MKAVSGMETDGTDAASTDAGMIPYSRFPALFTESEAAPQKITAKKARAFAGNMERTADRLRFYKFEGVGEELLPEEEEDRRRAERTQAKRLAAKSRSFNRDRKDDAYCFINDAVRGLISGGVFMRRSASEGRLVIEYLEAIGLKFSSLDVEEVTLETVRCLLREADRRDFLDDSDEIQERFGLLALNNGFNSISFGENLITCADQECLYEQARRLQANDTLLPELDRIYAGSSVAEADGHPVHYVVETDNRETRKKLCQTLLQALYDNCRITNMRYSFFDVAPGDEYEEWQLDSLYACSEGGAVLVRVQAGEAGESDCAEGGRVVIERLCAAMKKYRHRVLTVFCFPRECARYKELFFENLGATAFVEVREDFLYGARAAEYLRSLAKESGVREDKKLLSAAAEDKGYLPWELQEFFDEWYNQKLRSAVYPQYKDVCSVKKELQRAAPGGSAYDELMEMVGLDEAKKVIDRALKYAKAQKLFAEKGMKNEKLSMHMVFTGNPGTAKTTAARLFARILKENGILSKGHLIEVGRGDLVGKYVGWTAPTIQKKFLEAMGSVLFIDEAYSLVDDRSGSYGDEAINAIVQEMENHREDVVVIFAGYPDKMEDFLGKNPGLRSRIAFHVSFADYSAREMRDIATLLAKKKGLRLTDDACEKLEGIFEAARRQSDFGNGRYVRNVLEKARMAQSERLLGMDYESVGRRDVQTILPEDIELPVETGKKAGRIGF